MEAITSTNPATDQRPLDVPARGTAVVTGAASGIGAALARCLHDRGWDLVLVDIDPRRLAEVADPLGATASAMDVADAGAFERLAAAVGPAELLCLNAGVLSTHPGPVWEAPPAEWERVLAVNLGGVVNGLRAFVPRLLAAERPAHILVTASLAGLLTWPGGGPYAASKHAVVAVAEQTALALEGTPVGVTMLCPALVRSGMSPDGMDPGEVANDALRAVDEHRFAVVDPCWVPAMVDRVNHLGPGLYPTVPTSVPFNDTASTDHS